MSFKYNRLDKDKATGRKQLIIAGIVTDVCLAFPALSVLEEGFEDLRLPGLVCKVLELNYWTGLQLEVNYNEIGVMIFKVSRNYFRVIHQFMQILFKVTMQLFLATKWNIYLSIDFVYSTGEKRHLFLRCHRYRCHLIFPKKEKLLLSDQIIQQNRYYRWFFCLSLA